MKLPGITYGRVQSLGREDVTAPGREAQASAEASLAWADAVSTAADTVEDIEETHALELKTKAMNVYHTEKLKWQAEQEYYDENSVNAKANGHQRFSTADDAARAAAGEILGNNNRAQIYFNRDADRANVQYGDAWQRKVVSWNKDEQFAQSNEGIEVATQMRDFDTVDVIIEASKKQGVFTSVQAEVARSKNDVNRTNSRYVEAIGASSSPENHIALREQIKTDPKLSDTARAKYEKRLDNQIISTHTDGLRQAMTIIEDELGTAAAVEGGDAAIHAMAKMSEEEDLGFATDAAIQANRNALRQVWNEWKVRAEKQTAGTKRRIDKQCAIDGTCLPTTSKTEDQQRYDDRLAGKLGWIEVGKTGYDKNGIESGVILADDSNGFNLRQIMVGDFASSGYVAKGTREALDAAMTSNKPEVTRKGVELYKQMSLVSPGAVVAKQAGIVSEYSDIIQAFGTDRAVAMIQKSKSLSPAEQDIFKKSFDDNKFDESGFDDVMKTNMPTDQILWFEGVPAYKDTFKRRVEARARDLMPMVDGDIIAAYTAAAKSVSNSYNVDQELGKIVEAPFATSLPHGNIGDGKWAHDLIEDELPAFNDGDMPDDYSYAPTPDFDPVSNPAYVVSWVNEENEFKAVGFDARFEDSKVGKEYFHEMNQREMDMERERRNQIDIENALSGDAAWDAAPLGTKVNAMGKRMDEVGGVVTNVLGSSQTAIWDKIGERMGVIGDKFEALGNVRMKRKGE